MKGILRSGCLWCCAFVLASLSGLAQAQAPSCRQTVAKGGPAGVVEWEVRNPSPANAPWCETVGPALVIAPQSAPGAGATNRVVVVSWNIHVGNGRVPELLASLQKQDKNTSVVLLMQEGFRRGVDVPSLTGPSSAVPGRIGQPANAPDIRALAGDTLWAYYVPSMRNGNMSGENAQDRGNAILSNLPLRDFAAVELPFVKQRRVAIMATVTSGEGAPLFRVVVLHLTTGGETGRNEQALHLSKLMRASSSTLPVIVGGDLNSLRSGRESAIKTLREVWKPIACGTSPTFRGGTVLKVLSLGIFDFVLDHLFAGGNVRTIDCTHGLLFGSDHYPLILEVAFN